MSAPDDGPVYELGRDVHLGERVPGEAWVGDDGRRRFVCALCEGEFVSDPSWSDAEREAEELVNLGRVDRDDRNSVCDECYPKVLAAARAEGLLG